MGFSAAEAGTPDVLDVSVSEEALTVELSDGRTLAVPTGWYPRLAYATQEERANWTIIDGGQGVHWRELDEDVSLAGLLAGRASSEGQQSLRRWLGLRSKSEEAPDDVKAERWILLSHPSPLPPHSKPGELRFPDGGTLAVKHQYELAVELTKWLRRRGYLPDDKLPIPRYANPRSRDLGNLLGNSDLLVVARADRHSLANPRPAGDLFVETKYMAEFQADNLRTIIEWAGLHPSDFAIWLRKEGRNS